MLHVTEHTPKVSIRSINPSPVRARGKSDRKTDGRTERQTHRRIVQNQFSRRFEGFTSQIRPYLKVDFLHDANTSINMEVKRGRGILLSSTPCKTWLGAAQNRKLGERRQTQRTEVRRVAYRLFRWNSRVSPLCEVELLYATCHNFSQSLATEEKQSNSKQNSEFKFSLDPNQK